jgi:uncharacterized Tic20 family protein
MVTIPEWYMRGGSGINFRFILTITVLVVVVLLAVGLILVGYAAATQHAMGKYAPLGQGINATRKSVGP